MWGKVTRSEEVVGVVSRLFRIMPYRPVNCEVRRVGGEKVICLIVDARSIETLSRDLQVVLWGVEGRVALMYEGYVNAPRYHPVLVWALPNDTMLDSSRDLYQVFWDNNSVLWLRGAGNAIAR